MQQNVAERYVCQLHKTPKCNPMDYLEHHVATQFTNLTRIFLVKMDKPTAARYNSFTNWSVAGKGRRKLGELATVLNCDLRY